MAWLTKDSSIPEALWFCDDCGFAHAESSIDMCPHCGGDDWVEFQPYDVVAGSGDEDEEGEDEGNFVEVSKEDLSEYLHSRTFLSHRGSREIAEAMQERYYIYDEESSEESECENPFAQRKGTLGW